MWKCCKINLLPTYFLLSFFFLHGADNKIQQRKGTASLFSFRRFLWRSVVLIQIWINCRKKLLPSLVLPRYLFLELEGTIF